MKDTILMVGKSDDPHRILIEVPFRREDGSRATETELDELRKILKRILGAWSEGRGGSWENDDPRTKDYFFEGVLSRKDIEFFLERLDAWATVQYGQTVLVDVDSDTLTIGMGRHAQQRGRLPDVPTYPTDWPKSFDVGVLTVIGPELHAAQDTFLIHRHRDVRVIKGNFYYAGELRSSATDAQLSLVLHCLSRPGNSASAAATSRLLSLCHPKTIFLSGLAAGRKGKVKIGDVVTPIAVLDQTIEVATPDGRKSRPLIGGPPHPMMQMARNFRYDANRWHQKLLQIARCPSAPIGKEQWWQDHVAERPSRSEDGLFSSNLLLRDGEVLEAAANIQQQIRIGDMEAAGFIEACQSEGSSVPWYVVRAVSDFGDPEKNDAFHTWAAASALTFLSDFVEDCLRPDLLA